MTDVETKSEGPANVAKSEGPAEVTKNEEPAEAAPQKPSPRERALRCSQAIHEVLAQHGCAIHAVINEPEYVGTSGGKLIVTASYCIVPH